MGYFGLLGYPLGHSFSKPWFEKKKHLYENFEFADIKDFIGSIPADIEGFNVTIPHKQAIIEFLDEVDNSAREVGAVNCVKILVNNKLKGYNTDIIGFETSLRAMIGDRFEGRAAVLGSGGASKAVCFVLKKLNIDYQVVSRSNDGYSSLKIQDFRLIINTTPLGMHPKTDQAPPIDYSAIDDRYFMYDLVYNPAQTQFLRLGRAQGATVVNGLSMLWGQAQAALQIFVTP